ncbi:hypothetical protein B6N58_09390 [Legionella micdadei]|uniref:Uncharacterized protein n=1 Tax=Legionella micdadei TaxID=451 RepID=A0A098GGC8_LEGMI|nr:hypothetical protein B6N58_09390 [Legionella micdadei]ARG99827.1 hypothetical protein B6V88_05020 [Legionella micdadei]KTD28571.1 hypothetical protein Lmic_1682 [Legionella micdadei]CEG60536.1 protein of unknown function [Legionella micdadei]SCX80957.1 hypothetical protein SAMN02982997_00118 [Legionella micdadei]
MTEHKDMISSEEARLMLLDQKNADFHQTLLRIEKRLDNLESHMDNRFSEIGSRFDKLDSRIDSNFKWILAFILPGILGIIGFIIYRWF